MTLNQLASKIAKQEGKKSQIKIGDIREALRVVVELEISWMKSLDPLTDSPLQILAQYALNKIEKMPKKKKNAR